MSTTTTKRFWFFLIYIFYYLWRNKKRRKFLFIPILLLIIGFLIPQQIVIPVENATPKDWNKNSFWAYPWGNSITHKGIDIFKAKGTNVVSATYGIVIYTADSGKGGKNIMILGPKWRFHYYAHLNEIKTFTLKPIKKNQVIGTVGDTGNAKGKPPHLHYSIATPFPYIHLYDSKAIQGWRKMFYLNPDKYLRK